LKPQARESGLLVRDLGGECVVYDLDRHEAHCLNPSAAAVFRLCDGDTTVREIAERLAHELDPGVNEDWVEGALDGLSDAHLLQSSPSSLPPATSCPASAGRRELLRRAGVGAALLVPAVVSMVAPTPAEAANTCVPQASCTAVPQPCWKTDAGTDCPVCNCSGSSTCTCS
jgi:hypothetical protein